jgi:segregation and condensation protein B
MSNKKTKTQPVKEPAAVENITPENGVIADEAPRNVVFEEALEAILFAAGHPISYATLARVFEMTPAKVRDKVFEYSLKYNAPEISRGVIMLVFNDSCQLCTKKYYLNEIREALGIRKSGTLSTSSMEVLAIVAYNQPVTRVFVDTLRRADSSYAMNNLLDRGLIESKGRLDAPGRPMLYGTTNDFLRCFGLKDLKELPQTTEEIQTMFANTSNVSEDAEAELEGGEQISLEETIEGTTNNALAESAADSEATSNGNNDIDNEPSADEMIENGDDSYSDDGDPSADEYIDFTEDEG